MNYKLIFTIPALLLLTSCGTTTDTKQVAATAPSVDLVNYVNPLMGTDSKFSLSNGNTYPAIATPWAMNFWTPMTAPIGDGWTYKYNDDQIRGIKQTHQPSPWLNDYGAFSLMAVTGEMKFNQDDRASWYSHKAEQASPDYYSVYLASYDVTAEVTPTERAAQFRFTFPDTDDAYIILDAFDKGSMVKIIPEERKIIGYARNNHGGVPDNFHNYFVAEFDKDFEISRTWTDEYQLNADAIQSKGEHVGAVIGFKTKRGETVSVKIASSFISPEQAQLNLDREIGQDTFDTTREKAHKYWQDELSRIEIVDDNKDNLRTFYSALYRVLLFPRKFYEYNQAGEVVHYSPYNGEVLPGYMFTDNGFWDTFRAVFPFFTLMYPELDAQIMEGLANTYKESGWLPEWASPGHRGVMIGSNSAVNIADAYLKGITDIDIDTLYEAIVKNAQVDEGRPVSSVGREGVDYYNELGYVPYDVGIHENAARTLEYAFADFNIYRLAERLGKTDDATKYKQRAMNYKHLFDKQSGWMRGKNEDGSFQTPFNPLKWGDAFTEGNSLHYTWSVFHDISGLKDMMGGDQAFVNKLDSVFSMPPTFDDSYYGFTIHEIREMQIVNMGNYAHGNQPIQHMSYLYNYAGQPWKTQYHVRNIMDKLYSATPDGYCGDEDNGQTSAWYVFSALGFYPVAPGSDEYVLGSPLFDKATLHLQNGERFTVTGNSNSKDNIYVNSAKLNGKTFEKTFLSHQQIQRGGEISFDMSSQPNKSWATNKEAVPYSMSTAD
ncbi:alpha-1,2-mannosidase [Paraglaciecola mesophila KMM 241]|uniref:Alpha-1,2-mannosidase n=1 Tax=Paraglaciecola mesophila KMM 241 TaxID=1128912 RepID=K6Z8T0_9ALTE|nr:GH92 family glycosyl hydrolase [Paraglaciecola mesophila]GAC25383.1 alpha-1,2-mannosidase [Paraglaciecola mesophila KMM 241]|tara:strand:+ start:597 stop:2915 length:2319 start_codon:yes stop_codon:yes gene_type:complete